MKTIVLSCLSAAALAAPAPAELVVFRVCEDQHVLRSSDGADAGQVEYFVMETASNRVVSAVVTGGVLMKRSVAVPISAIHFGPEREVILQGISRQDLLAAPVFEISQSARLKVMEADTIEEAFAHFGYDAAALAGAGAAAPPSSSERSGRYVRGTLSSAKDELLGGTDAQRRSRAQSGGEAKPPPGSATTATTETPDRTAESASVADKPSPATPSATNSGASGPGARPRQPQEASASGRRLGTLRKGETNNEASAGRDRTEGSRVKSGRNRSGEP